MLRYDIPLVVKLLVSGISARCPSLMARQGRLARLFNWLGRLEVQRAQLGFWQAELASVDSQLA